MFSVVSTFSGGGGSSLGYELAGGKVLLAVELGDNAAETYHLNSPKTPIHHGDISDLSARQALKLAQIMKGDLGILDGSPPCQGFSIAGNRRMDDDRNQLFMQFARLLKGMKPRAFIMENVTGMVKGKMRLIFADCLRALGKCGYRVSARVLNAMYYDVPQRRQRLIFIGIRKDLGIIPTHPPPLQQRPPTTRDVIADLSDTQVPKTQHIWIDEWARDTKWIHFVPDVLPGRSLPCNNQFCRLRWDEPSLTICTSGFPGMGSYVRGAHIHPRYHRVLSVRELARLGTFPDRFKFVDPLGYANQIIGNSVPPNLMKALAGHVAGILGT